MLCKFSFYLILTKKTRLSFISTRSAFLAEKWCWYAWKTTFWFLSKFIDSPTCLKYFRLALLLFLKRLIDREKIKSAVGAVVEELPKFAHFKRERLWVSTTSRNKLKEYDLKRGKTIGFDCLFLFSTPINYLVLLRLSRTNTLTTLSSTVNSKYEIIHSRDFQDSFYSRLPQGRCDDVLNALDFFQSKILIWWVILLASLCFNNGFL